MHDYEGGIHKVADYRSRVDIALGREQMNGKKEAENRNDMEIKRESGHVNETCKTHSFFHHGNLVSAPRCREPVGYEHHRLAPPAVRRAGERLDRVEDHCLCLCVKRRRLFVALRLVSASLCYRKGAKTVVDGGLTGPSKGRKSTSGRSARINDRAKARRCHCIHKSA